MTDFKVITEGNPLYAEIDRLKRERDALADALAGMLKQFNEQSIVGIVNDERGAIFNARSTLAQVRK